MQVFSSLENQSLYQVMSFFENKHSNFVYFRFLQKMFSKMLTDTLVLLLCTAATAGENGKFPRFNPIYAPEPLFVDGVLLVLCIQ